MASGRLSLKKQGHELSDAVIREAAEFVANKNAGASITLVGVCPAALRQQSNTENPAEEVAIATELIRPHSGQKRKLEEEACPTAQAAGERLSRRAAKTAVNYVEQVDSEEDWGSSPEKALSDYKATEDECSSANELDSEADLSDEEDYAPKSKRRKGAGNQTTTKKSAANITSGKKQPSGKKLVSGKPSSTQKQKPASKRNIKSGKSVSVSSGKHDGLNLQEETAPLPVSNDIEGSVLAAADKLSMPDATEAAEAKLAVKPTAALPLQKIAPKPGAFNSPLMTTNEAAAGAGSRIPVALHTSRTPLLPAQQATTAAMGLKPANCPGVKQGGIKLPLGGPVYRVPGLRRKK